MYKTGQKNILQIRVKLFLKLKINKNRKKVLIWVSGWLAEFLTECLLYALSTAVSNE
jgi:hypothetical protein